MCNSETLHYQGATTPCRSPGRTSFPSLGGTADGRLRFRSHRRQATNTCGAGHIGHPVRPHVPGFSCGSDRASHVPGEPSLCLCPALRPRQDRSHPAILGASARPPFRPRRRLLLECLSRLNHTAWALAVYAWQGGSLHHHARLASGCRPSSSGRACYPQGSGERFQSCLLHHSSSFPKLRGARSVTQSARMLPALPARACSPGGAVENSRALQCRDRRRTLRAVESRRDG